MSLSRHGHLVYGFARVGEIQVEPVLVAVQRHDVQACSGLVKRIRGISFFKGRLILRITLI